MTDRKWRIFCDYDDADRPFYLIWDGLECAWNGKPVYGEQSPATFYRAEDAKEFAEMHDGEIVDDD